MRDVFVRCAYGLPDRRLSADSLAKGAPTIGRDPIKALMRSIGSRLDRGRRSVFGCANQAGEGQPHVAPWRCCWRAAREGSRPTLNVSVSRVSIAVGARAARYRSAETISRKLPAASMID